MARDAGDDGTFVGYHGTSSASLPSLGQSIDPPSGLNFGGDVQLGMGLYTTADHATATYFAERATIVQGGRPVIIRVHARDFARLQGQEVPRSLWWTIADDSPLITRFDYLTAPVAGFESARQVKFNPRAYGALTLRWDRG